jgi:hypothetical protein
MKRYKIHCDMPAGDALKMAFIWTLMIFVTAGVAGIFLPFFWEEPKGTLHVCGGAFNYRVLSSKAFSKFIEIQARI